MSKIKRLYINLTNKCVTKCPFCFMYGSPQNSVFINFNKTVNLINTLIPNEQYELQLGGGETLLHPDFVKIVECGLQNSNVKIIYVDTNGLMFGDNVHQCQQLANKYQKKVVFKVSVNYWIYSQQPSYLSKLEALVQQYNKDQYLQFVLSIRHRVPIDLDQAVLDVVKNSPLLSSLDYTIHSLEFAGRGRENLVPNLAISGDSTPKAVIPVVVASDGTVFDNKWLERSQYERSLACDPL